MTLEIQIGFLPEKNLWKKSRYSQLAGQISKSVPHFKE